MKLHLEEKLVVKEWLKEDRSMAPNLDEHNMNKTNFLKIDHLLLIPQH